MGLVRSSVQRESTWTFIWTPVESPARKVQSSTVLLLSAVHLLLLREIMSHKQTQEKIPAFSSWDFLNTFPNAPVLAT